MLKKFVGETYTDAFLQAKSELGDEVMVVTSRVFNQRSLLGMYSQEMVEVTVSVREPKESLPVRPGAPARPVPTEDVSALPAFTAHARPRNPAEPPSPRPQASPPGRPAPSGLPAKNSSTAQSPSPSAARSSPSTLPRTPRPLHSSLGSDPQQGRFVNTLRSNQVGDQEPHSQHLEDDAQETEKILQALKAIQIQRGQRPPAPDPGHKVLPVAPAVPAAPSVPVAPRSLTASPTSLPNPVPVNPGTGQVALDPQMKIFETHFKQMYDILKELHEKTAGVFESPSRSCPEGLLKVREKLQVAETPPDALEQILEELQKRVPGSHLRNPVLMMTEVRKWITERLQFGEELDPPRGRGPVFISLIGPTGVGKTTTIAKLAAQFALNRAVPRRIALFTLDTFRIGAPAQLAQYAQIIEADMEVIMETSEIPAALERHRDKDLILVDTAGRCPKNRPELEEMKKFLACFPKVKKFLTLSATTRYSDMLENTRQFGEVGFDSMIVTKIDETNSIGPLLGLLMHHPTTPLAYVTHGQSVPDDMCRADHDLFLNGLFPNS